MDGRKVTSVAIVCFLIFTVAGVSAVCIQANNEQKQPAELHAVVTGYDSFDNRIIDIDTKTFYDSGYKNGDYVILSWHGFSTRAIVVPDYNGLFVFEYFVHTSSNGEVCIARQCASLSLVIGDEVDIRYHGASNRGDLMPRYVSGVCDPAEWMTDEDYVNFRCIETTGMKSGMLYRSYNSFAPMTNDRASVMDTMFDRYEIGQIIDMKEPVSVINANLESGDVIAENARWYVDNDRIFAEDMSVKFLDREYKELFEYIADNDGPYLLHCSLGKDRTGFVAMVLEALTGATYEEMITDYCLSYVCLYDIDADSSEYDLTESMFVVMMIAFHDPSILEHNVDLYSLDVDVSQYDFKADAESYLTDYLGLSSESVNRIKDRLSA